MGTTLTATLRAVDYLRVSTEEQAQGYGIPAAAKKTTAFIARKGWAHVDTFKDEGVSGSLEADQRENLARLMRWARQTPRPFDVVTVSETRAIGRVDRVFWRWVWELEDLGIFVAVVDKDIDNTTEAGRDAMREEANYAFKEYGRIRKRTQDGLQEKAVEGGYTGGTPPYGWRIADQGKKKASRLVLDEDEEVPVLRRARTLMVELFDWRKAALRLNAEGLLTRSGVPWSRENLRGRLMSTAVLESKIVFRNPAKRDAKLGPDGNPVHGESVVISLPPIFTEEELKELKRADKRATTFRSAKGEASVYPLSRRFFGLCGRYYVGHKQTLTQERWYTCSGKAERFAGGPVCTCPGVSADLVEAKVWGEVSVLLGDAERLQALAGEWVGLNAGSQVSLADRITDLDRQIETQDDAIGLTMAVAAKQAAARKLSPEAAEAAVERATKSLYAELEQLTSMRDEAAAWQQETEHAEERAKDLVALAEMARSHLQDMTLEDKAEVLGLMKIKVTLAGPVTRPRKGAPCSLVAWFAENNRQVPVLTDRGWAKAEAAIAAGSAGKRRSQHERAYLEGILRKVAEGLRWIDVPLEDVGWKGLRNRWNRWYSSGTWEQIMAALEGEETRPLPEPEKPDVPVLVDGVLHRKLFGYLNTPTDTVPSRTVMTGVIRFQLDLSR